MTRVLGEVSIAPRAAWAAASAAADQTLGDRRMGLLGGFVIGRSGGTLAPAPYRAAMGASMGVFDFEDAELGRPVEASMQSGTMNWCCW